jgi:hypothetical protein
MVSLRIVIALGRNAVGGRRGPKALALKDHRP